MQRLLRNICWVVMAALIAASATAQEPVKQNDSMAIIQVKQNANLILNGAWFGQVTGYYKSDSTTIDTVEISLKYKRIRVIADRQLAFSPVREATIDSIEKGLGANLGEAYHEYSFELYSGEETSGNIFPIITGPTGRIWIIDVPRVN